MAPTIEEPNLAPTNLCHYQKNGNKSSLHLILTSYTGTNLVIQTLAFGILKFSYLQVELGIELSVFLCVEYFHKTLTKGRDDCLNVLY